MRVMAAKKSRMAGESRTAPLTSKRFLSAGWRLGRTLRPMRNETTPMGTLMRKMTRQGAMETRAPPMVGPDMAPRAVKVASRPRARPRLSANISVMMPWLLAMLAAIPRPWTARAAIRTGRLGASALRSDPTVKVTTPNWKTRTLPIMSPRRPKVSRNAQLTTSSVLETHWTRAMSTSKAV